MTVQQAAFGTLIISYDERVLTPRPWTLSQSRWALELLHDLSDGPILELCAGAGQIGLAVAAESGRQLVCVDAEPVAAGYARHNAAAAGLHDQVEIRVSRISEALRLDERFPLILADPPWVRRAAVARFPEDPLTAIDGGLEGLDVARECISAIGTHLDLAGAALLQLGSESQAAALDVELAAACLRILEIRTFGDRGVLVLLAH